MTHAADLDGEALLAVLGALSSPHRLRIVAALHGGPSYISQMARDLGISRPLLSMHLQKLEAAGLVTSEASIAEDGKARRYFAVADFSFVLDVGMVAHAAATLPEPTSGTPSSTTREPNND